MIPDQAERAQALDTGTSFAVAAPAGSGKTGLLTQRMLCLLAESERPESVLCMTFTRKAAAEMRRRISDALTLGLSSTPPDNDYERHNWELAQRVLKRDQVMGWQLMASLNRLQITTIDGFCRLLAQQLAVESGLGVVPENTETPSVLYRQATRELLAELESSGPTGEALEILLTHVDNNHQQLEDLLMELIAKREQWLSHVVSSRDAREYLEGTLTQLITDTLVKAQQQFAPFTGDLTTLLDYISQHIDPHLDPQALQVQWLDCSASELAANPADCMAAWQALSRIFLTNDGSWRKQANKKIGLPTKKDSQRPEQADERKQQWKTLIAAFQQTPGLLDLLNDVLSLPNARYDDTQWAVLDALTHLLPQLAARLQLVFQREGQCDFTETALAAQRALHSVSSNLGDDYPTDLALQLDYRIQHILVDECQDTSSLQFNLLRRLTAGWQANDGRTLFLVGDAMQSLYGFRNANVGLFLDSRRHPIGDIHLQALDLSTNFRSHNNIIHWVNRVFTQAFPDTEDSGRGATPYAPSAAAVADMALTDTHCSITLDTLDSESIDSEEGEQVAHRVLAAQDNNPEGSIAILVRGRRHLKGILPALYNKGLSWQAADIDSLSGRMPVIDLMSLTRALLCPADRIAWLALLRAPWSGLNHRDLHSLVTHIAAQDEAPDQDNSTRGTPKNSRAFPLLLNQILSPTLPEHLSDAGRQIVQRLAGVLAAAWQQRHRKPLRTWIEGVWIALGGPAALLNPSALQHCRQYFNLLETHSTTAAEDWASFLTLVEKGHAAPEPDADPHLQIMTIHKAKGLEFDTVIIPGLHRPSRSNQSELLLWREHINASGQTDLMMSPPASTGSDTDRTYQHLRREQSLKGRLEDARVLYVACTRAKSHLHLLFKLPKRTAPGANTPLALLWEALSDDLKPASERGKLSIAAAISTSIYADVLYHPTEYTSDDSDFNTPQDEQNEQDEQEQLSAATLSHGVRLPPHWRFEQSLETGNHSQTSTNELFNTLSKSATLPQSEISLHPTSTEELRVRLAGTLFHRTARQIVLEGIDRWDSTRIARQKTLWRSEFKPLLADQDETQATIAKLERAVIQLLAHPEGKWLLAPHPEHVCEWPLAYVDDHGQMRTAILDRSFVADDVRWIVDYKLAEPTANESLQDFLQHQKNTYHEQLTAYQRLLENRESNVAEAGMTKIAIKIALYFPLIPHLELL
ncbi:MAG: UvrD-helicase domain-containing protein [Porticoccaceae bacterium]